MKKFFLYIIIFSATCIYSQINLYNFQQNPGTYSSINGGTILGNTATDDERFVDPISPLGGTTLIGPGFPVGFNFLYNGDLFDRIGINANGWVAFGKSADGSTAVNLTSTSYYLPISTTSTASPTYKQNRISALGRDIQAQTGATLRIETIGSAPDRICVIQWQGFRKYNATGDNFTFQIRLYETTGKIDVVYGTFTSNTTNASPQVGIRGLTNTDYSNRTGTNWSTSTAGVTNTATMTLTISSFPVSGQTYTWAPQSGPQNPNSFTAAAGGTTQINLGWLLNAANNDVMLAFNTTNTFGIPTNGTPYSNGSLITGGGTVLYNGNGLNFNHTGLTPSTTYYYKLWSKNGSLEYSSGVTANTNTLCAAISSFPYNYNFESVLNSCWSIQQVSGTGNWEMASSMINPTMSPQSGTHMAQFRSYDFPAGTISRLRSPLFDFSSNSTPSMDFYMTQDNGYPSARDSIIIEVSTNLGANWVTLPPAYQRYNASSTGSWRLITVDLSVYANNPSVIIGIKAVSVFGNNMAIDNITIKQLLPMTYVTGTTTQTVLTDLYPGFTNQQIIGIQVVTTNTGSPLSAQSFLFNTNGSTNPSTDILNAKLYYTGTSNVFAAVNQFGVSASPSGAFTMNGSQQLNEGTNYFWMTYDINATATTGNFVDAECSQIVLSGTGGTQIPLVQAPSGNRLIAAPLTGINVGPGEIYTSLTNAGGFFEAVNNGTVVVGGPLFVNITGNLSETGTFALNQWISTHPIVIRPSMASEMLISGSNSSNGLILINGADNLTFDGRYNGSGMYLKFRNTNSTRPVIHFRNDANNNTLRNCIVEGNNTNYFGGFNAGVIFFGTTNGTTGNDNNNIINCNVSNRTDALPRPGVLINSLGLSASISNDNNSVSGCNLFNFNEHAIRVGLGSDGNWSINGNSFYTTDTLKVSSSAVKIDTLNSGTFSVTNNYFGGSGPLCTGTFISNAQNLSFIDISFRGIISCNITGNITRNVIQDFIPPHPSNRHSFRFISVQSSPFSPGSITANVNISGNYAGDTASTGNIKITPERIGDTYIIYARANGTVSNNTIAGINAASFSGIIVDPIFGDININNNKIGSFGILNSIAYLDFFNGIKVNSTFMNGSSGTASIIGNKIINVYQSGPSSNSSQFGIETFSFTKDIILINNFLHNLKGDFFTGLYVNQNFDSTSANYERNINIENNSITSLAAVPYKTTSKIHGMLFSIDARVKCSIKGNIIKDLHKDVSTGPLIINGMSLSQQGIGIYKSIFEVANNFLHLPNIISSASVTGIENFNWFDLDSTAILNNSIYISGSSPGGSTKILHFPMRSHRVSLRNNLVISARTPVSSNCIELAGSPVYQQMNANSSNYNTFITNSPSTFANSVLSGTVNIDGWKNIVGSDKQSWLIPESEINVSNLFVDLNSGNLRINHSNPEAWVVSGKGIALSGLNTDIEGDPRPTSVSGGVTDIGADEFTQMPPGNPLLQQSGTPGPGVTTIYWLYNRKLAEITWGTGGTSYPSSVNLNYFSGITNPNISSGNHSSSYFSVNPLGFLGDAAYDIKFFFGENETYSIQSPSTNTVLSKFDGVWNVFPPGSGTQQSELDWTNKTITVRGLNSFSDFILTDNSAPLPVSISEFSAIVNSRNVKLKWVTQQEINNKGFEIERRLIALNNDFNLWKKISFMEGNGNSNNLNTYEFNDNKLASGNYQYRLKQIDFNGNFEYYNLLQEIIIGKPAKYDLSQNYPNPSNPLSKIDFTIPFKGKVSLKIYDMLGREVVTLIDKELEADYYTAEFDGSNLASGVYFYRIIAEGSGEKFTKTLKMVLVK